MNAALARRLKGLLLLIMATMISGCDLNYAVEAANYGQHGVILMDAPISGGLMGQGPHHEIRLQPGIPTVRDDKRWLGKFLDFEDSLPKENIEITWQLAKLNNCGEHVQVRSAKMQQRIRDAGYSAPKSYGRKSNCTWTLIEGAVYHQKIDMQAIRNSEAYKKAGAPYSGVTLSKNLLRILLTFQDEELEVKTYTVHTNPWK